MTAQDIIAELGIADPMKVGELFADGTKTEGELVLMAALLAQRNQQECEREEHAIELKRLIQDMEVKLSLAEARYALLQEKYDAVCMRYDELVIANDEKSRMPVPIDKVKELIGNAVNMMHTQHDKIANAEADNELACQIGQAFLSLCRNVNAKFFMNFEPGSNPLITNN